MIACSATISIAKPLADVFDFVANVENIPQWVSGAHVVKLSEGPVGEGTLFREKQVVLRMCNYEVNRSFETESVRIPLPTRFILQRTRGRLRFEQLGQATQVILEHQIDLTLLMKPFERLVARKAQRDSEAALEQLKNLLEKRDG